MEALLDIRRKTAQQQPQWDDSAHVARVRDELSTRPALVTAADTARLRDLLAQVAAGEANVVQAGDCAEDPAECTIGYIARKAGLLDVLAGTMKMISHKPVVRSARVAGQFAKPRSNPTELVGDQVLPVYRGHMVNCPEPDPERRRPDPDRMLAGYRAASDAMQHLGWWPDSTHSVIESPVWTSHEALLLDYEIPMMRCDDDGRWLLTSTHWPWIGERTRQVDGAHVALLAEVVNPVACKVGPSMQVDELLALCERLDPRREKGRLTFIVRMGADTVAELLPPLVAAVKAAGHPVVWMTDPMHGNTVTAPEGLKTRLIETIVREVEGFQCAVRSGGGIPGGLHLETTPDAVTECACDESNLTEVATKYTSFCDPRLNPEQAISVVTAWRG